MARGYKTGGRQKGSLNKRTMARLELQDRCGIDANSPALTQMRKCATKLLDLADEEQRKGEQADQRAIRDNLDSAARILKELAQYEAPKLTAVRVGGDPVNSLPLDIKALSDDQLHGLIDRLSAEEKV
jgi:hypothetical protein